MHDELRLRVRMIGAGIWLSVVLVVAVSVWIAATWGTPHRGGLAAMTAAAALATAIIAALPRERVVSSRYRELFFLAWSLSLIAFIAVAAGLDDGVRSPIVLILFLTLVYAALSYPRWAVAVVTSVSLLAVLILSQVNDMHGLAPTDHVYLMGLLLTLAVTGTMCMWQAHIQQEARAELARLSRSDTLTECLNRLGFAERLEAELARVRAGGADLALVLIDFDGFKAINDELGHTVGDELLRWSAGAMALALRPGDTLGRLGGDEFTALLPRTDLEQGQRVADRLQLALSERIGACAGVASTAHDGESPDALLRCADERLYEAKGARPHAIA